MEPDTVLYEIGKNAGKSRCGERRSATFGIALNVGNIEAKIGEEEIALFDPTIAPAWKAWGLPIFALFLKKLRHQTGNRGDSLTRFDRL